MKAAAAAATAAVRQGEQVEHFGRLSFSWLHTSRTTTVTEAIAQSSCPPAPPNKVEASPAAGAQHGASPEKKTLDAHAPPTTRSSRSAASSAACARDVHCRQACWCMHLNGLLVRACVIADATPPVIPSLKQGGRERSRDAASMEVKCLAGAAAGCPCSAPHTLLASPHLYPLASPPTWCTFSGNMTWR